MNEKQYQSLYGWAARTPARQKCLTACFRLLPVLFVFLYGIGSVCALSALVQKQVGLWIAAFWAIPAAGFLLVTLIRKKLNRPRPAQLFHFVPLVQHEDGCSFPSRHTSSAFLITCALFWLCRYTALPAVFPLIAAVSAVLTALSRVVAGVHFPRDVIAGAAFGIGFSVLCLSVLPF